MHGFAPKDAKEPVAPVSLPEPLNDSPATVAAEPVKPEPEDIRAGWRPNKIYESNAAKQRAYRERKLKVATAASSAAKAPIVEPAPIMPVPVIGLPVSDIPSEIGVVTESRIPWGALSSLVMPGPDAILSVQPIDEAAPVIPEPVPMPDPINWEDELRTDLPPRTPGHIARLLLISA